MRRLDFLNLLPPVLREQLENDPELLKEALEEAERMKRRRKGGSLARSDGVSSTTAIKRANLICEFAAYVVEAEERHIRTDALRMARAIALAGLPKRPTKKRQLSRVLRLGSRLWLRVTYTAANPDVRLAFGEDRFVLAAIQHLALEQDSPVVYFDRVGQLLEMFDVVESGQSYERLRQRFQRIAGLAINMTFAETKQELGDTPFGEQTFVIRKWALPTRSELEGEGQMRLPGFGASPLTDSPFGVILSSDFWEHLQEESNHLIVPLDLLKLFIDQPTGWDYLLFLVYRCTRAKRMSVVPHDVLISLFGDGKESDRHIIRRLQKYHEQIMQATGGRLKAELMEMGNFPSTGGRPKKRWGLKVQPSKQIVWSGKKPQLARSKVT